MDLTGALSSECESSASDGSSLTPEVIPTNPRSDAKRKVTFKKAGRPPLNRDQNLLTRLAANRLKGKFQHAGRPSSVSYYNGLDKNEDDDEVTNGIRNLTLRSKSVSPALARRSSTPLQKSNGRKHQLSTSLRVGNTEWGRSSYRCLTL